MELATTYTKTVSLLGVEVLALRELVVVCHALAFKLDDTTARKELLARVNVLENVSNQLQR
jgi:hypothetical protein